MNRWNPFCLFLFVFCLFLFVFVCFCLFLSSHKVILIFIYSKKGKVSEAAPVSSSSDVVRPTAVRATSNGISHSTALTVAELFSTTETVGPAPMPLHSGGSLFERLSILSVGAPTGVPPPIMPNTELHTAQNLERELRGKVKVWTHFCHSKHWKL